MLYGVVINSGKFIKEICIEVIERNLELFIYVYGNKFKVELLILLMKLI